MSPLQKMFCPLLASLRPTPVSSSALLKNDPKLCLTARKMLFFSTFLKVIPTLQKYCLYSYFRGSCTPLECKKCLWVTFDLATAKHTHCCAPSVIRHCCIELLNIKSSNNFRHNQAFKKHIDNVHNIDLSETCVTNMIQMVLEG